MTVKRIFDSINILYLLFLSLLIRARVGSALVGGSFDTFGRKESLKFLFKGDWRRFFAWACNPVSIVRYFEFPFAYDAVTWPETQYCLDVSSPRLFLIYSLKHNPHLSLEVINPDADDLCETKVCFEKLTIQGKVNFSVQDATRLPYADQIFDLVTSISVLEHIPDYEDSLAIEEMWRVLKPGGKLIITIPCAKNSYEEWRDTDTYNLSNHKNGGKYFFQRFYDSASIKERIIRLIGLEPIKVSILGEKRKDVFKEYEQRWINKGFRETIADPLYITRDYKIYSDIESLPGIGVCGLVFEK